MNDFSKIDSRFIKENEWIIKRALGKYSWLTNYEEVLQEARIWLCEAKQKFNKKRSSWVTYAGYYIRHSSKVAGRSPEEEGYSCVGLEVLTDSTLYKNNIINDETIDNEIVFNSALNYLEEGRNKNIVILITLGFTYREVGKRYDITCQRVAQIYNAQIKKIKEHMV
jgi:RNA polymerase sigma factor (sigma-70 family)